MTEEDRLELLSVMYDNPEDPDSVEELVKPQLVNDSSGLGLEMAGKSVMIRVDGKGVEVPSAGYVRNLEKLAMDQSRQILRLTAAVKTLRTAVNGHVKEINDLWREVERKLDMR